ncbi:DUF488 domain-containing protein [Acidiphilium sp. AL]|uniref:DUF488 domain-containing protein n=1 Tax=Acidiphilium iwatense TaxID=768198 RepID=A0ABS9DVL1_9PROT|nr:MULTISPECIES: DUF488 domain-containing protein [Acidiphilium]MCF3946173.1 DUF488 domain-containing protein [Acidiphilium iwatense]MCU4158517.1 DUF488 domain-containing protein [Acidiphilium sp. AL]
MARILLRRAYDPPEDADGMRVLVDRLWPRGLAKAGARIDLWLKEIAPSDELRREFGHNPARWDWFAKTYRQELAKNPEPLERLVELCRAGAVTLLFAAHDTEHNNAVVLRDMMERRFKK